jgi:hypothetical protein
MLRTPLNYPAQGGCKSRVWRRRFCFSLGTVGRQGSASGRRAGREECSGSLCYWFALYTSCSFVLTMYQISHLLNKAFHNRYYLTDPLDKPKI